MNRGERRRINQKKWLCKLKKLFRAKKLHNYLSPINEHAFYKNCSLIWKDFKGSRIGVQYKNTRTPYNSNRFDIQEIHKRNLTNRNLSKADIEEVDYYNDFLRVV